jgi:hypothetical protein
MPPSNPIGYFKQCKNIKHKDASALATAFVLIKVFRNKYRHYKYHTQVHVLHNHALIEMGNNECFPTYEEILNWQKIRSSRRFDA